MQGIFFDLDGTLLNESHQLSTNTIRTVKQLVQGGLQYA